MSDRSKALYKLLVSKHGGQHQMLAFLAAQLRFDETVKMKFESSQAPCSCFDCAFVPTVTVQIEFSALWEDGLDSRLLRDAVRLVRSNQEGFEADLFIADTNDDWIRYGLESWENTLTPDDLMKRKARGWPSTIAFPVGNGLVHPSEESTTA